jgi:gas vesicle protein
LRKFEHIGSFWAGLGIGVAVSVLFAPEAGGKACNRIRDIASRAGDVLRKRTQNVGGEAGDVLEANKLTPREEERSEHMSDLKDKAKKKIDDGADAAKKATDQVVDKAKDVAHKAGKKMEEGGKRLQDA